MKKIILITFTLAITLFACKNASFYTKKGDKYFTEGNFETAIQNYQQALEKGAPQATTNFQIGESYRLSNRKSESAMYYKNAIANGSREESAPFHYGMALKSSGNYSEAKQVLDNYVKVSRSRNYQKLANYESKKIEKIKTLPFTKWEFELKNEMKLNSNAEDYGLSQLGNDLIITSSRGEGELYGGSGFGFTDLYLVSKDGNITSFDETGTINTPNRHEANATFTPDGNTMVFARSNTGEKKEASPDVDLYMSVKDESGKWGEPVRLPINLPNNWEGSPLFSKDGKYLYFASDRRGGKGGLDLWRSQHKDGRFSSPKNMGATYNTFGNEMFPFIHDNGSFYFASDGHVGYGGLDMFKIVANSDGKLEGKPINMGHTVNTTYDDFGLIYTDRFSGYLCSNREGGMGGDDIYSFNEEVIPYYYLDLEVKGNIGGKEIGVDHAGITFVEENKTPESNFTDELGHYKHQLHKDDHYEIKIEKDSFFTANLVFNLDKNEIEKNEKNEDGDYIIKEYVTLKKFGDKETYDIKEIGGDINDILYDVSSWEIREDAAKELDKLIEFLTNNPGISIELGSHTDSRDTDAKNLILSTKRAESAVNYILKNESITENRIAAKGYGESRLINRCANGVKCSEEEHQANRRTEIKILDVQNVNSDKYKAYLKAEEEAKIEAERVERLEKLEEEHLMIDELNAEIEELESKNLTEENPEYSELQKKKAKLAELEKHYKEEGLKEGIIIPEEEKKEVENKGEGKKKNIDEESEEYLEMKKKYEEMQKMMDEVEKNKEE